MPRPLFHPNLNSGELFLADDGVYFDAPAQHASVRAAHEYTVPTEGDGYQAASHDPIVD